MYANYLVIYSNLKSQKTIMDNYKETKCILGKRIGRGSTRVFHVTCLNSVAQRGRGEDKGANAQESGLLRGPDGRVDFVSLLQKTIGYLRGS